MRIAEPKSTLISGNGLSTMTSRVDPEGARRIMEMLVNLYADQRLAVTREYVSNAVDATREAGSNEPVLIKSPTMLEPNLNIADKGTGMSAAEVEATFLAFAASTKRDSNEMIGGLGVGAKSAWTLAESFLVDTVKDGRRTMVRAARNLEHQVIMADAPSDLPNGTTITVPVAVQGHTDAWKRVIHEVASAHDEGAVWVDGEPVESLAGGPTWIGPVSTRKVEGRGNGYGDLVVIRSGGTLFTAPPDIARQVTNVTRLKWNVVELPIGSFDHTPSRESVIATERTKAAVSAALDQYRTAYGKLDRKISELANTDLASAVRLRTATLAGNGNHQMLPIRLRVGIPIGSWIRNMDGRTRWDYLDGKDSFDALAADAVFSRAVLVTDVPQGKKVSGFAKYLDDEHSDVRRLIAFTEGAKHELKIFHLDGIPNAQTWKINPEEFVHHYTYTDLIEAIKKRRVTRGKVDKAYECTIIDKNGARFDTLGGPEIAALGVPVIYIQDKRPYRAYGDDSPQVKVYLGKKRKVEPLLAAVPHAMSPFQWEEKRYVTVSAGWSETELLAAAYTQWSYKAPLQVAAKALAVNPKHSLLLLTQIAELLAAAEKIGDTAANLRLPSGPKERIQKIYENLIDAYPLLGSVRYGEPTDHSIDYVAYTPPNRYVKNERR